MDSSDDRFGPLASDLVQTKSDPSHPSEDASATHDSRSLIDAWVPRQAKGLFSALESRLSTIENALKRPAPREEDSVSIDVLPPQDLPSWMGSGSVQLDSHASADSVWADEGLVVMSEHAAGARVPETDFGEVPYADDDDFIIIEDPVEEGFLVSETTAPPSVPDIASGYPEPATSDAGWSYAPSFQNWPTQELSQSSEFEEIAGNIPADGDLLDALDSNFGIRVDGESEWPTAPEELPDRVASYAVFGEPAFVDGVLEYFAMDPADRTQVRLRVLADGPVEGEPEIPVDVAEEQLAREEAIAGVLLHTAFPRLIESGERDGKRFVAYEAPLGFPLLEASLAWGPDVREWCARRVSRSLAESLEYLHERGVILGEIDPSKILLSSDLEVRFADISRACLVNEPRHPMLGKSGVLLAPEVRAGGAPTPRSDQYTLGAVLYEMLTGVPPEDEAAPLEGVSPLLVEVAARLLSPDPRDRFESAAEVARYLTQLGALTRQTGSMLPQTGG